MQVEKKLAERVKLCYVEGKKKKGKSDLVPTLFADECVSAICLLLKHHAMVDSTRQSTYFLQI